MSGLYKNKQKNTYLIMTIPNDVSMANRAFPDTGRSKPVSVY